MQYISRFSQVLLNDDSLIWLQKRNKCQNFFLFVFPVLILVLLVVLQNTIEHEMKKEKHPLPPIPNPPGKPPALQIPWQTSVAVRSNQHPYQDLPDPSCRSRENSSCPVTFLVTASNQSFAFGITHVPFLLPLAKLCCEIACDDIILSQ